MHRWILFWFASLVLVSMTTLALAQGRLAEPRMLSGDDVGFRMEGTDLSGKPTGTFMVRLNGTWVEIGSTVIVLPVK